MPTKTLTVHCEMCWHQWEALLPLPLPVSRAVMVMQGIAAAGCPVCGAHGETVLHGPSPGTTTTKNVDRQPRGEHKPHREHLRPRASEDLFAGKERS